MISLLMGVYAFLGILEYQILETGAKGMPLTYMGDVSAAS